MILIRSRVAVALGLALGCALLGVGSVLRAQSPSAGVNSTPLPLKHDPKPTSAAITSQDLMTRLYIFADDSLAGRDVGTEGHVKATDYLAREAQRIGLMPGGENGTFFQTLPLKTRRVDRMSSFVAGGASLAIGSEWAIGGNSSLDLDGVEVIYAGAFGETSAELPADQVKGRVVAYAPEASNAALLRSLEGSALTPAGAAGVLFLLPPRTAGVLAYALRGGAQLIDPSLPAAEGRLFVSEAAAAKLFPKPVAQLEPGALGAKLTVKAHVDVSDATYPARNVVALLPGSDAKLKQQYVAIGAHSDHVGVAPRAVDHDSLLIFNRLVRPGGAEDEGNMGTPAQFEQINAELADLRKTRPTRRDSIFNGADDDGSGSVAVLEIAEYLASLKTKPKRSTLFVWHAGEEKGLWGSAYFTEHPTVPRDSIVAQLNMDMVGRGAVTDVTGMSKDGQELRGGPDYLQLVGSRRLSSELGDLIERVNKDGKYNFVFDYAMDANGHPMNIYCRSDHYEYAKWGIPVTFFTTGGHSAYHQLTDEPQYIDYPHMQRVTRLVAGIALELGNLPNRPKVDGVRMDPHGACVQ
ncbi:M28 family peptidase [Gemmatimonas aurantiaca]|uniref:M28 family peptidase n=1 Tax=Gemmatimonas aurantiaca TaxID=173480 RepID=UPI00301BF6CA